MRRLAVVAMFFCFAPSAVVKAAPLSLALPTSPSSRASGSTSTTPAALPLVPVPSTEVCTSTDPPLPGWAKGLIVAASVILSGLATATIADHSQQQLTSK